MKKLFTLSFLLFAAQCLAQAGYDTVDVFFSIGIHQLNSVAKEKIDATIADIGKKNILIYGYADYLGNESANLYLAKDRANEVRQYLFLKKLAKNQILICEGIGEVNSKNKDSEDGNPHDRRVSIFIKKENFAAQKKEEKEPERGRMIVKELDKTNSIQKPISTTKTKKVNLSGIPTSIVNSRFDGLAEMKPNEIMRIETIHFQPTRHFLLPESEIILNELLQTMQNNPNLAISIEGHVCCVAPEKDALDIDTYELKLSENRAKYIYDFLVTNGIEANRLAYIGFGKRNPIVAIERNEFDAQKNRRVEFRVLRND